MSVYKRGKTWTVKPWLNGKKIEKAVGPDRSAALTVQKEMEASLALSKAANTSEAAYKLMKPREKKTIRETFADYMLLREATIKPSTKRTYLENFRSHIDRIFGDIKIRSITKYHIADFQNAIAARCSATRTNSVVNLLRSILKHCVMDDLIAVTPARGLRSLREEEPNIDPLTLEELEMALRTIPEFYRQIYVVLAWTGMRPNELKALRWSDIDWHRNEIKISKGRVKGVESTAKTRSSKRIITQW